MMLQKAKKSSFQPKKRNTTSYLAICDCVVPSPKAHRPEIIATASAIVRELHVYGPLVPVGKHSAEAWQHRGFGADLLKEAERIAREDFGVKKLLVISALGTRRYYMRFGYERDGVYVSKKLENPHEST